VLPVYRTRERLARMYTKNRSGSMSLSLRQNYQIAVKFPQRRSLASLGMRCQRTRSRSRIAGGSRAYASKDRCTGSQADERMERTPYGLEASISGSEEWVVGSKPTMAGREGSWAD
jgi:hypothetical protein